MAPAAPQNYANHARLDPLYHFVLLGLILASLVLSIMSIVHQPGIPSTLWLLLTLAVFIVAAKARAYALKAQDRVICLEERLRLAHILPATMQPRIAELTVSQLIALRFASDGEVPALVLRAMDEHLTSKQIKTSIQSWRADNYRV